jgi:hypothetical protein
MKKLFIIFLIIPLLSLAQNKKTKLEIAISKNANFYRVETDDIDFIKGVNISYVIATNINTNKKISGITLEGNFKSNDERQKVITHIDKNEILALTNAKNYLLSLSKHQKAKITYQYESYGGFKFGVLTDASGLYYYIQVNSTYPSSIIGMDKEELKSFLETIIKAKSLI